jgi:hypothetical protein
LRVKVRAAAVGEGLGLAGIDLFGGEALVLPAVDAAGQLRAGQRFSSSSAATISCLIRRS